MGRTSPRGQAAMMAGAWTKTAAVRPGEVQVRDLTFTPTGAPAPVLEGVDLDIAPGERVLLTGVSGAGKSTLLRALAGVLADIEPGRLTGRVTIDGLPVRPGDGRVGLLLQDPTDARVAGRVGRDVAFGPENLGLDRAEVHRRVLAALAAVGFPYGSQHRTDALSGGEAQRLALAGVLAMAPGILLLDEPTSMLDDGSAGTVRSAVLDVVRATGATLVVVEHHLGGWGGELERLIVLGDGGHIVGDGPLLRVFGEQAADLAARGLWVPGVPPPPPVSVPADLVAPWRSGASGAPLLRTEKLTVRRRQRLGLSVAHRRAAPTTVLDEVDVAVRADELHVLRGGSGAGKSTLVAALCGLEAPSSGRVVAASGLAGDAGPTPHRWRSRDLADRIGWVPQRAESGIAGRRVADSLLATGRALGRNDRWAQTRARDLLALLGLEHVAQRNPYQLSGGEQRRLAVATGLAHGPTFLGVDEPTIGLDRHTWAAVVGLLTAAGAAGAGVFVATHDDHLSALAARTTMLVRGRIT